MKIARVILLAALLLSAFPGAAFASEEAVAFIPLVSRPDSGGSIAAQAHRTLQPLMPRLLAAQAAGQIIRFEPILDAGILEVVYRPSVGLPDLAGSRLYSQIQDAAAAVAAGTAGSPGGAPSCTVPLFYLYLYGGTVSASCLTPGARLLGSMRDPGGRVVGTFDQVVGVGGSASGLFSGAMVGKYVIPGYIVTFKVYVGGILTATFKVNVPKIKFTSINKAGAIVKGIGPAGKPITLTWVHQKWDAADSTINATKVRTISSAGIWQVDFGTIPIRGADFLHVDVRRTPNFVFSLEMNVPYMYCTLGGNYCEFTGFPLTPVSMQIIHGGQTYAFSGSTNEWGWLSAEVKTPGGVPVLLGAYDKVSATGVAQYALPNLTANLNYTTDTVSGKVPAYKYFRLSLYEAAANAWTTNYIHSNGAGTYSSNFMATHGVNLLAGNPYVVRVYYVLPTTGNTTDMFKAWAP